MVDATLLVLHTQFEAIKKDTTTTYNEIGNKSHVR